MSVPFHKQTDPNKQAGQVVNPIPEQFLHQYIAKKDDSPPRITFDAWVDSMSKEFGNYSCYAEYEGSATSLMELAWNAALTKGKL